MKIDWKNLIIVLLVVGSLLAVIACKAFAQEPIITYVPEDEIKWVCEGSQGDEIITVKEIDKDTWEFYITPVASKLSAAEIQNYPFEAFRKETIDGKTVKVPLRDIQFEVLSSDTKLGATQLASSVDLTRYSGVVVTGDPRDLAGSYIKYGVHSATYSAVNDRIEWIGDTSQLFLDIYEADLANGWGQVTSCGTGVYCLDAQIYLKSGTVSDDGACVNWLDTNSNTDLLYNYKANLTLTNTTLRSQFQDTSIRLFYSLVAQDDNNFNRCTFISDIDDINEPCSVETEGFFTDCIFHDVVLIEGENESSYWAGNTHQNDIAGIPAISGVHYPHESYDITSIANVNVLVLYALSIYGDDTFLMSGITATDNTYFLVYHPITPIGTDVSLDFTDCYADSWTNDYGLNSSGTFTRSYTLDALVVTNGGTPIQDATVEIENTNYDYSYLTSSSGTIPTVPLRYETEWFDIAGNSTDTFENPYTVTVSKTGYLPHTDSFVMDTERDLRIALQVDSGTDAGDVMGWMEGNIATLSWWEENMSFIGLILLVAVMLGLAYWADRMMVYFASGFGVGFIGLQWIDDGTVEMGLGIAILILAAWLLFQGVWQPITGHVRM